jgi:hypothetical protein
VLDVAKVVNSGIYDMEYRLALLEMRYLIHLFHFQIVKGHLFSQDGLLPDSSTPKSDGMYNFLNL